MMDSMYLVLSMEFMLRKYDKQIFQCKYYCKYIATTSKNILNFKMVPIYRHIYACKCNKRRRYFCFLRGGGDGEPISRKKGGEIT